jgi:nucleoside-diphosphate-sugar epimerase
MSPTGPVTFASSEPVPLKTIIRWIGEMMAHPDLVQPGAIPAAATDAPLVVADMSHISKTVGWRPSAPVYERLARTIAWWRDRKTHAQEVGD